MKKEEQEQEFKIRVYLKTELAQLYSPHLGVDAALRKLQKWIRNNTALHTEVYGGKEGKNEQAFSKRQVEVLVRYLDAP